MILILFKVCFSQQATRRLTKTRCVFSFPFELQQSVMLSNTPARFKLAKRMWHLTHYQTKFLILLKHLRIKHPCIGTVKIFCVSWEKRKWKNQIGKSALEIPTFSRNIIIIMFYLPLPLLTKIASFKKDEDNWNPFIQCWFVFDLTEWKLFQISIVWISILYLYISLLNLFIFKFLIDPRCF